MSKVAKAKEIEVRANVTMKNTKKLLLRMLEKNNQINAEIYLKTLEHLQWQV